MSENSKQNNTDATSVGSSRRTSNGDGERITYFAETDYRNNNTKFGIKAKDRAKHVYVIGKTGMGKSTLLENFAVQDIQHGNGFAFIDPHGKSADLLLEYIPEERMKDVLYFAPFDLEHPVSFNVMEDVGPERRHLVASGLMSAFKKIWVDAWSARMEYILNNALLALLEYPDATILGVNRMLADKTYRKRVVANISDVSVKAFWQDEFEKYSERFMTEAGASIQNKVGQFISNPLIRNIIGQPRSTFDIREMMDNKKILIIDLSKGKVGEDNANLIGSMLITKIYLAAMSRADVTQAEMAKLPNFYIYVDEFQSFANESFADILSEARKYKLNLTIAHQYIEQMSDEVRAAVFGNVGTMITFRVGSYDADIFEKEFAPEFTAEDMVNLGFIQIYLKLMIDGIASRPFSAKTLGPIKPLEVSLKKDIIDYSRSAYGKPRDVVADVILRWHESPAGLLDDPQVDAMRRKKKEEEEERLRQKAEREKNPTSAKSPAGRQNSQIEAEKAKTSRGANSSSRGGGGSRDNRADSRGGDRSRGRGDSRERNSRSSIDSRAHGGLSNNENNEWREKLKKTYAQKTNPRKDTPERMKQEEDLRKVISLRQLEQKEDERKKAQNKKKNDPESISNLRSALADVIRDANRGVEEKVKKVEQDIKEVKKQGEREKRQNSPSTEDPSKGEKSKNETRADNVARPGGQKSQQENIKRGDRRGVGHERVAERVVEKVVEKVSVDDTRKKTIYEIPKPDLEKMLEVKKPPKKTQT